MDLAVSYSRGRRNDLSVFDTLMVAFCVIVVHVFGTARRNDPCN